MTALERRYLCEDQFGQIRNCSRGWYDWGRWVALAVILVAAFLFFFLCSLLSARRRRRQGLNPYYGTGWTGRTPLGHGPANYNPHYGNQQSQYPPPQYSSNQGYYGGQNQGYYSGQQNGGVEMQPPPQAYRAGDNVYEPPAGPPPGKK